MYISHGDSRKKVTLYPPARSIQEFRDTLWLDYSSDEETQPISLIYKNVVSSQEDENQDFLNNLDTMPNFESLSQIFSLDFQEGYDSLPPSSPPLETPLCTLEPETTLVEISPGKSLYISSDLNPSQREQLVNLLRNHLDAFAWSYEDMKIIPPETCRHHIYIQDGARPVRQPQRRMNPTLRDVVKEELQKLLDVDFIYPISDSQWVSPLVLVLKKDGR